MSWRFLVGVARNLAGLVAALHARGLVLGDVSHANIVVSGRGYLTFLDCDSMQFVAPMSGERFPCLVFTAEYAAPELHRGGAVDRTPESDCFSLSVLVCRLLLMGDHPYMGIRRNAPDDDESGIAENIREGYSYLVRPEEMNVPANGFAPSLLPPALLDLAVGTLGMGHTNPAARPSAADWVAALGATEASLQVCPRQRLHVFSGHLTGCPWCERTAAGFSDPFVAPVRGPKPVPALKRAPAPLYPPRPPARSARPALAVAAVPVIILLLILLILIL
jgi:DNA-binding helix-hairpin-helix protein with protein kinase domain